MAKPRPTCSSSSSRCHRRRRIARRHTGGPTRLRRARRLGAPAAAPSPSRRRSRGEPGLPRRAKQAKLEGLVVLECLLDTAGA